MIADRLNRISESETIAMAKLGRALKAEGKDIISLSFGEPDFFTPDHIKQAAIKAIEDNFTFYTPVAGIPDLKEAISQKFMRENGLQYNTDQIVVSTGAKNSIMNAVLSLVNPGDEVIIPRPFWVSYADTVHLGEGVNVYVRRTNGNREDRVMSLRLFQVDCAGPPRLTAGLVPFIEAILREQEELQDVPAALDSSRYFLESARRKARSPAQ